MKWKLTVSDPIETPPEWLEFVQIAATIGDQRYAVAAKADDVQSLIKALRAMADTLAMEAA